MKSPSKFETSEQEHTCSTGRKFKFRELNAFEQMSADSISDKMQVALYYRAAFAIVSVDDEELVPARSDLDMRVRLESLAGSEADELVLAYVKAFQPKGDDLKNESTPAA